MSYRCLSGPSAVPSEVHSISRSSIPRLTVVCADGVRRAFGTCCYEDGSALEK
jgi:hypothetical protein